MNLRPLGSNVVVEPLEVRRSPGGIVTPEQYLPDTSEWRVVAVGPKVTDMQPGQRVLAYLGGSTAPRFEIDGKQCRLIHSREVLMVIGVPPA